MITATQLVNAVGFNPPTTALPWLAPINNATEKYEINTPKRMAMWLGQMGWESRGFTKMSENLNYDYGGLIRTFPSHFDESNAAQYAHEPIAIANHAYANRHGNGTEDSGDGWLYRGRGFVELTFKDNYVLFANDTGLDVVNNPDLLLFKQNAALVGAWYWAKHGINTQADAGDIEGATKAIAGCLEGLSGRKALWERAKIALDVGNA